MVVRTGTVDACGYNPAASSILTTGNLSTPGSTIAFDLVTPVPGAGHDQLRA